MTGAAVTSMMSRTAIILVASGLSRRFGRRDKMMASLAGAPLVEHAARAIASLNPLTRVAVCPSGSPAIGEQLIDRFVIAVNKKPKQGLGHSIALGAQIALQFKPDQIMVCMGDMPFIEPWLLEAITARLASGDADIVHAGGPDRPHPPTIFGPACFEQLAALDGDDGAKALLKSTNLRVVAFSAPAPLLLDIDTRDDLELAHRQIEIRTRYAERREMPAALRVPVPGPRLAHETPTDPAAGNPRVRTKALGAG